ncbi:hypothetical protein Dehly_0728 [Dehalogenimonas lykanthroporepellens BL-DC-9]|nr:hypothetical protein Dehly_0728 [Dehalogenimonas lykanthroporepellens BL-DC-9]
MDLARYFDNRKFMWDGVVYETEAESKKQEQQYSADGFDVKAFCEDDKYYLFTRRVVKEVSV